MRQVPDDPTLHQLAGLRPAVADPVRQARVRARCHAALARRARRGGVDARAVRLRYLELAGFGTFAAVYVLVVVREMLASYGG